MKSSKALDRRPVLEALRAVVVGSVAGAALCAVFLGIFSLLFVSAESIPQGILSPLVIGVSVISAFAAGFIAAKLTGKRGILFGAAAGMLLFALFLLSGLAVSSNKAVDPSMPGVRLLVMLLSGSIGGIVAVSRRAKIKHK